VAKANFTIPGGAKVTIEGTPDEVASTLKKLSTSSDTPSSTSVHRSKTTANPLRPKGARKPAGPVGYIRELITEDFFEIKRTIGDVQKKLEANAHIYSLKNISPALLRLVGRRELRRLKEAGVWLYVNR